MAELSVRKTGRPGPNGTYLIQNVGSIYPKGQERVFYVTHPIFYIFLFDPVLLPLKSEPEKLLKQHNQLTHTDMAKVSSHVQRTQGDWILNTIMIENCDVPFKYKRKKQYKNLKGQRVNLTYYPCKDSVAGIEFELMKVVRIKIA